MTSDTEKNIKRKKKPHKNKSKKSRKRSRSPISESKKSQSEIKTLNKNVNSRSSQCKISVSHLTENVGKDHLMEIFQQFGMIIDVVIQPSKAVIIYETKAFAKKATKMMNGGMIDKQEIKCAIIG